MRRTACLLVALLILAALGSDSPKEYDDKAVKGDSDIEGKWQIVAVCNAGKESIITGGGVQDFQGGKWHYLWHYFQGHFSSYDGSYTTDNSRTPAFLDETSTEPSFKMRKCIYQIEGETLRIAWRPTNEGKRPTSFDEKGLYILIWKRVRK